jgi:GxxExxY protein
MQAQLVLPELSYKDLVFVREKLVSINYLGSKIGKYFLDFFIENKLILELKAKKNFSVSFYNQILDYLKQLDLPLGLVVNFRSASLVAKRVINSNWSGFLNSNKFEKGLE